MLIHGIRASVADSFPKRAKGLLGRDGLPSSEGLLIPRCNAIHTIGMRFPIDAEFLSRDGSTLRVVRDIPPGRPLVWGGWRARQVLETQAGAVRAKTTDGTNLYGSVRVEDIVSAIAAQGVDIDRTQIGLEAPITAVGQFDVPVKLHPEVELKIKVWVVEA